MRICYRRRNQPTALSITRSVQIRRGFWRSRVGGSRLHMILKVGLHRISSMNTSRKCVCPLQILYMHIWLLGLCPQTPTGALDPSGRLPSPRLSVPTLPLNPGYAYELHRPTSIFVRCPASSSKFRMAVCNLSTSFCVDFSRIIACTNNSLLQIKFHPVFDQIGKLRKNLLRQQTVKYFSIFGQLLYRYYILLLTSTKKWSWKIHKFKVRHVDRHRINVNYK